MPIDQELSCANIVESVLHERLALKPKYSLRQFAGDLKVSPAYLSLLLKGKRRFPEKTAPTIAKKLGLKGKRADLFVLLSRYESESDPEARQDLEQKITRLTGQESLFQPIKVQVFKVISRWYHNAIYALAGCKGFTGEARAIAARLGISHLEADLAVERLLNFGVLKRDGRKMIQGAPGFSTGSVPSEAIRDFHKQMLDKARAAIDQQDPAERDYTGVTLAFDPGQIAEVKEAIRLFRQELVRIAAQGEKSSVYQLSVQFFRLDRKPRP